jgi:murein L,D-transpeptidase YafK
MNDLDRRADRIAFIIRKADRSLIILRGGEPVKSYAIALGFTPVGPKEGEGDGKTPQGEFYVAVKNPESKYRLALCISYPGAADAERGLCEGMISLEEYDRIIAANSERLLPPQGTKLGGAIYIHGGGTAKDWTRGCVAVRNEEMSEIYDMAEIGTPITILP